MKTKTGSMLAVMLILTSVFADTQGANSEKIVAWDDAVFKVGEKVFMVSEVK